MKLAHLRNTALILASSGCWLSCPYSSAAAEAEPAESAEPAYSAEAFRKTLDPFYKQHIVADGLVVAGSEKVSLPALREVGYLSQRMLANRPDVISYLCEKKKMFVGVMAYCELQTDLPDCRGMSLWWAYRARGLGSTPVSCGEENVLNFKGDPWEGENIFIHEFAHGIERSSALWTTSSMRASGTCLTRRKRAVASVGMRSRAASPSSGPRACRRGSTATGPSGRSPAVGRVHSRFSDRRVNTSATCKPASRCVHTCLSSPNYLMTPFDKTSGSTCPSRSAWTSHT